MKWLLGILVAGVLAMAWMGGSSKDAAAPRADTDWCAGVEVEAIAAGQVEIMKRLKSSTSAKFSFAVAARAPKDPGCLWYAEGKGSAVNDFNVRKDFEWAAFVRFQSRANHTVEEAAFEEL